MTSIYDYQKKKFDQFSVFPENRWSKYRDLFDYMELCRIHISPSGYSTYFSLPDEWGVLSVDNQYYYFNGFNLMFGVYVNTKYTDPMIVRYKIYNGEPKQEIIDTLQFTYPLPSFYITTSYGKIIINPASDEAHLIELCSELKTNYERYIQLYPQGGTKFLKLEKQVQKDLVIIEFIKSEKLVDLSLIEFNKYCLYFENCCPMTEDEIYEYCIKITKNIIEQLCDDDMVDYTWTELEFYSNILDIKLKKYFLSQWAIANKSLPINVESFIVKKNWHREHTKYNFMSRSSFLCS